MNTQEAKREKENANKWERYYNNQRQSNQTYADKRTLEGRPLAKPASQPSSPSCGGYHSSKIDDEPEYERRRRNDDALFTYIPPIISSCGNSDSGSSHSSSCSSSSCSSSSSSCSSSSCGSSCGGGSSCGSS